MRTLCVWVVALVLYSAPVFAAPILIYREVETVMTLASVTGLDGVTHTETDAAIGSVLSDDFVTSVGSGAKISDVDGLLGGYPGTLIAGTEGSISEAGYPGEPSLQVGLSGYASCDGLEVADCYSAGRATVDVTFRASDEHTLRLHPYSGTVSMALLDLTSHSIIHQGDLPYYSDFHFDFPNNHLYRFVASSSVLALDGDPYGDFSVDFFDRVTGVSADFASAPVPEPMTMTLLGSGIGGLAVRRWRQRRKFCSHFLEK